MSKTWIIAKHEFMVTVSRKGYLLVLFGMPMLFGGIIGVSLFSQGSLENAISNSAPTGVVDQSGLIDFSLENGLSTEGGKNAPGRNLLEKPLRGGILESSPTPNPMTHCVTSRMDNYQLYI